MTTMRLGRKAVKTDSRTLHLARYLRFNVLPPLPPWVNWTKGQTSFGMMLNDQLGDCTCAGVGHATQIFSLNTGTEVKVTDAQVLSIYEKWCGYNPADPSTDQGGIELDVLHDWKAQGFAGKALDAYAAVNVSNQTELKHGIALFGGLYIGFEVPNYIMDANTIPAIWTMPKAGQDTGIAGGHCVFVVGYNSYEVVFISWGSIYRMAWSFWNKYVDEAYCLISSAWFNAAGVDPSGFNMAQLQADLIAIQH